MMSRNNRLLLKFLCSIPHTIWISVISLTIWETSFPINGIPSLVLLELDSPGNLESGSHT